MKLFKKLAAAGVCTVMAAGMYAPAAFAAEKANVQLNGTVLENVQAERGYDCVYMPFRTLLEGLNAEVEYNVIKKTVTASHNGFTAVFTAGSKEITVTGGNETFTVTAANAPYEADGTIYLPVRAAAQALGCYVGWDNNAETVILLDTDSILGDVTKDYTMMDSYIKYSKDYSAKYPVMTGKINFGMDMNAEGEKLSFKGVCDITAVSKPENIAINSNIKLDVDALIKAIESAGELDPDTKEMMESLNEFTLDFYMDMKTGKLYVASDIFPLILDATENTWILFDLNSLMALGGASGFDFTKLMDMSRSENFAAYAKDTVDFTGALSSTASAQATAESLYLVKSLFSDGALTAQGNNYVSSYTVSENGADMTIGMVIKTSDGKHINGSTVTMVAKGTDEMTGLGMDMNMVVDLTGTESTIKLAASMLGIMNMTVDGKFEYAKTTDKTMNIPNDSNRIVSFEEIFM